MSHPRIHLLTLFFDSISGRFSFAPRGRQSRYSQRFQLKKANPEKQSQDSLLCFLIMDPRIRDLTTRRINMGAGGQSRYHSSSTLAAFFHVICRDYWHYFRSFCRISPCFAPFAANPSKNPINAPKTVFPPFSSIN